MRKWEEKLSAAFKSTEELKEKLNLNVEDLKEINAIEERYPTLLPEYYLNLIDFTDPLDPIKKMCLPSLMEFSFGGVKDTSGEKSNTVLPGLQHKYNETVLILTTNQCAMYCRHCFRKRLVGIPSEEIAKEIPRMREYVKSHNEINNVLLSGGDAFLNSTSVIERYLEAFSDIEHLNFIRIGTRTPVTFPYRITEDDGELLEVLKRYNKRKRIIVVTQFNHPRELTEEAIKAALALQAAGLLVRNQTVFLKGVNDDPKTLSDLMNGLTRSGIVPYYIFQCRPVEGVKNQFQVPLERAVDIVEEAKKSMSGPAKSLRFVLSHERGKIEILGKLDGKMLYKFHQAKDVRDLNKFFFRPITDEAWLDLAEP